MSHAMPVDRFTNTLHLPWPVTPPWGVSVVETIEEALELPSIWREIVVDDGYGVERVAVSKFKTPCPYCKQMFRNPAALKIHAEECHCASVSLIHFMAEEVQ